MKRSLWLIVSLLIACTPVKQPPVQLPTDKTPAKAEHLPTKNAAMERYLKLALVAFNKDQLLTPEADSAFTYYTEAQKLDPLDPRTARGFERISERYFALALQAAERSSFAMARSMLGRAKIVFQSVLANNPDFTSPNFESIAQQIEVLSSAERTQLKLDSKLIKSRDSVLINQLKAIGSLAKKPHTRVIITVRNDSDGRWVYQQLRKAPGEFRIRAEIKIGAPERVELVKLPGTITESSNK